MKDITTKFPDAIDDRIFFQNINIDQSHIMDNYYAILDANDYTKASEYLNNSGVYFYGAWLLNMLENRLNAIGNYLINEEKPKLMVYGTPSTQENTIGVHWIN